MSTWETEWAAAGRELATVPQQIREAVLRLAQRAVAGVRKTRELGYVRGVLDLALRDVDPEKWSTPSVDDMLETVGADLELLGEALERERASYGAAILRAESKVCRCPRPQKRRPPQARSEAATPVLAASASEVPADDHACHPRRHSARGPAE